MPKTHVSFDVDLTRLLLPPVPRACFRAVGVINLPAALEAGANHINLTGLG